MRTLRLLSLTLLSVLVLAPPALAADAAVDVPDFEFKAKKVSVDPGDTVTWNFTGPTEHTATADKGQAEKFDSGLVAAGGTFAHTFTKPGKFSYFCRPHEFMTGSVTVGTDAVAKSFTKASIKGGARSISASVTLKEAAKVTLSVKGKKVTKGLKKGKRKLALKGLKAGSYRATVTAVDAFRKKTTKKARATVR